MKMFLLPGWTTLLSLSSSLVDRAFAALPDTADVLGQWWLVSPSPLCPRLLVFLLPAPALSPLYSNQVASAALGAGRGSGRRQ